MKSYQPRGKETEFREENKKNDINPSGRSDKEKLTGTRVSAVPASTMKTQGLEWYI